MDNKKLRVICTVDEVKAKRISNTADINYTVRLVTPDKRIMNLSALPGDVNLEVTFEVSV